MKVAYHFDAGHPDGAAGYGRTYRRLVFRVLLGQRALDISSKVFTGDLLFTHLDNSTSGRSRGSTDERPQYADAVEKWLTPENPTWSAVSEARVERGLRSRIYALCVETIDWGLAQSLHRGLLAADAYIGAIEVDDATFTHWQLYSKHLIPRLRVMNLAAYVFWDGFPESPQDEGLADELRQAGFETVEFESLAGRFSLLDVNYDFEHARRLAELKRSGGSMLALVVEDVVHRLEDAMPDVGQRLWSALDTMKKAETQEQLAQVTATCRRLVEGVADSLFPATDKAQGGHGLGEKQYRNRLLAFADRERRSETSVDMICASSSNLKDQMERLADLANKGIHNEVYRAETRRCLLRTILLLDDILSLRPRPLPMKFKLDGRVIGDILK